MQFLSDIEIDGHSIDFEHGMLLFKETPADGTDYWHIVLLRVHPADMLALAGDPETDCAIAAQTTRGERLVGWARARSLHAAHDCLRLVGVSPLEWGAD